MKIQDGCQKQWTTELAKCIATVVTEQPLNYQHFCFKCIITSWKYRLVTETRQIGEILQFIQSKIEYVLLIDNPTKLQ